MKRLLLPVFASLLLLSAPERTTGQTVVTDSGIAGFIGEHTGPPAACAYPTGASVGGFAYASPVSPCGMLPGIVPFGPPSIGDVAVNRTADTVYVTDGIAVAEYTSVGLPIRNFPVPLGMVFPGPITGMDFDPVAGILWITNGPLVAGVIPPPIPGCVPPAVAVPAFVSPSPAPLTDITWDPATLTLWGCDMGGFVTHMFIGGALVPPVALAIFPVAPAPCALAVSLHGIAYDTATPTFAGAPAALYVSDGAFVEKFVVGGGPAPPTFYSPIPCYPTPFAPLVSGLSQTLAPIAYGVGTDPTTLVPPVMGATGQSATPSGPMTITITGAALAPGTMAGLFYSFGSVCPAVPFLGGNLRYLALPLFGPLGPFLTVGGAFTFGPFALPPALPVGLSVYMQWIVAKGGGGFQVSNAIEFTIGLP